MLAENRWRYQFVGVAFAIAAVVIMGGAIRLHFIPEAAAILEEGELYSGAYIEIYPPRGQIYDRYGRLLAGNRTVYEMGLEFKAIDDPYSVAQVLDGVFGFDFDEMYALASQDSGASFQYMVLDHAVQVDKANLILEYKEEQILMEQAGQEDVPSRRGLTQRPYLQRS